MEVGGEMTNTPTKGKYAVSTAVAPEKTQRDIAELLAKYQADDDFNLLIAKHKIGVAFKYKTRVIRFILPLEKREGFATEKQYQQHIRSAWRGLLVTIRGKLESVERGIETFDEAFMGQVVTPTDQTVAEWLAPQLDEMVKKGKMPALLPSGKDQS